ncbi:CRP-like cAMP-binding protein [Hypnocyclicus thermotrophus]|uniref:CRP-like cAMP-binding protein n=1 Tax=Hypnocyclicus thermotrophus TaxID=1627895 RepID=A0AA46DYZ0_9FUSO|nr:Crp/Fnr family transcriptional regulator [Hypnocyclicus thermotrophus]TDT71373.1 CRP-like cAMP-binding protein [Hypnocyclicus thermotrophus]
MREINSKLNIIGYVNDFKIRDLFENFDLSKFSLFEFKKNERIIESNEIIKYFYFLVEGKIDIIYNTVTDRELIIDKLEPLSIIGDVELRKSYISKFDVIAREDCFLLGINYNIAKKYFEIDCKFNKFIYESTCKKLEKSVDIFMLASCYDLNRRFATYLIDNSNNDGEVKYKSISNLADQLLASSRQLTRVLHSLETSNIIEKNNKTIKILNIEKLSELSID